MPDGNRPCVLINLKPAHEGRLEDLQIYPDMDDNPKVFEGPKQANEYARYLGGGPWFKVYLDTEHY